MEEGCTVEVMLYLKRTTEITYVQVDSGCVGLVREVDRFWVVPGSPRQVCKMMFAMASWMDRKDRRSMLIMCRLVVPWMTVWRSYCAARS